MSDYDLTRPLTWAECQAQDRAALASGLARFHDGSTVFVRYDDVAQLLSHPDAVLGYGSQQEQVGITEGLLHRFVTESFIVAPTADHTRLRSLVSRAFSPRSLEHIRVTARKAIDEALDNLRPGAELDVWEDVAARVPARVMCSLLGIPETYADELTSIVRAISVAVLAPDAQQDVRDRAERALEQLYGYVGEIAQEKLTNPGDDVISLLAVAERDGRISRAELDSMIAILLFTGTDTARSMLGLGLLTLAEHPEELAKLNANPELAATAADEILRFSCPSPWAARFAQSRIEHAGVTLEPGTVFIVSLATAGFDDAQFEDPWTFNIQRKAGNHLAFGRGRHACVGSALARLQGQEMLRALAARGLRLEVAGEPPRFIRAGAVVEPTGPVRLRVSA